MLKQPDLGTAMILMMVGGALFFVAGVRLWKFAVVTVMGLAAIPIAWQFLHEYQKNRILTFLDPESDPLGTGYHITPVDPLRWVPGGGLGPGFR